MYGLCGACMTFKCLSLQQFLLVDESLCTTAANLTPVKYQATLPDKVNNQRQCSGNGQYLRKIYYTPSRVATWATRSLL